MGTDMLWFGCGIRHNNGVQSYMGCGNHPSWIGHQKAANISIPIVKAALGW